MTTDAELRTALQHADANPIALPPALLRVRPKCYPRLVSLARALAVLTGSDEIELPQVRLGSLLGASQTTVGHCIHLAVADGQLEALPRGGGFAKYRVPRR